MKVAEVVVRILEDEGITAAFGIPGASINPVYEYLGTSDKIDHYTVRHEEAAVHAADGFFRSSGKMALAICTSGPGATNFVTGMYTAYIDSIPLIAITGQAVTSQLGKDAFQCVDIAGICKTVAKGTWCVTDPKDLPKVMREAFKIAREGKPGPVLIDLPLDVQMADIDYDPENDQALPIDEVNPDMSKIKDAMDLLLEAKAPVMIMGGGVILSGAEKEFIDLAEYLQIPVITTYMAKGGIPTNHPLNAGHAGIQVGQPIGNKVMLESDVVLGIGCRFTDRHTGNINVYKEGRKFIHINIEPSEIDKILKADVGIVSDAKPAIIALLEEAKSRTAKREASDRVKELPAQRESLKRKTDYDNTPIKPQRVYAEMNKVFDDETLFTTGCGLAQIWSGQLQEINKPRKYLPSGGAGTLGFDIPAAIGVAVGAPGKKVVAVMGDLGFTFLVEELAVAAKHKLPLVVVIVNNAYLGLIRQNQKYAYGFQYAVEMSENQGFVDYVKVSEGFGCGAERVFKPEDIAAALERAVKSDKPYVIDIICEEQTDCSMGNDIASVKEHV
jgi:tartronate-semialdehyde synthase